jgi:hypothetical protein
MSQIPKPGRAARGRKRRSLIGVAAKRGRGRARFSREAQPASVLRVDDCPDFLYGKRPFESPLAERDQIGATVMATAIASLNH